MLILSKGYVAVAETDGGCNPVMTYGETVIIPSDKAGNFANVIAG